MIKSSVSYTFGLALCILSGIVLFGWFTSNETLIRIRPEFTAMTFNTALCFFLMGAGIFFLPTKWQCVPRLTASVVTIITFITLNQYLLGLNLKIDQFFFRYNLETPMINPGRISELTAITILLGSIALYLLSFKGHIVSLFFVLFLSCFAISMPAASLIGYLTGFEGNIEAFMYARMALHTALASLLMGLALLVNAIVDTTGTRLQLHALSLATVLSTVIATVAVWRLIYVKDLMTAQTTALFRANDIKNVVNNLLSEDMFALRRYTERWEVLGGYSDSLWNVDGLNYINDLNALTSMQVIDKNYTIIKQTGKFTHTKFAFQDEFKQVENTVNQGQIGYAYSAYRNQLDVYFPIFKNGQVVQFLFAAINMDELFRSAIAAGENFSYKIIITYKNRVVFSDEGEKSPIIGAPITTTLAENALPFEMRLYITKASVERTSLQINLLVLVLGGTLSVLTGGIVYYALRAKMKQDLLDSLNSNLEIARNKAQQASIAKGAFLATMSHEIRTPLNAVIGTIQILGETQIDDTQRKYINRINTSSRALLNLINDILDYSKIEAGNLKFENEPFNFIDIAQGVCEGFLTKCSAKQIGLYLDVPEQPLLNVMGDAHRLEQVLMNLINNAVKFTEKGSITLKIHHQQKDPATSTFHCEIIDTGIGISPQNQQKLFQRFSQVEVSDARKFGGVGLGLSISKGIIERLQGQIGVKSEEGKGATFWFDVSFATQSPQDPPVQYNLENAPILLINSDQKTTEVLQKYLSAWSTSLKTEFTEDLSGIQLAIISTDQHDIIEKVKQKNIPILYLENANTQQIGEDLIPQPIAPKSLFEAIQKKRGK